MRVLLRSIVVKRECKAFKLMVNLCSYPHLWSPICVVTERTRLQIQASEKGFLQGGLGGLCLRDKGEELQHLGRAWSRAAAPHH